MNKYSGRWWCALALLCVLTQSGFSQDFLTALSNPPKREFRGAWIATVANLDWPASPGQAPDVQKAQLTTLLDQLKSAGISAVIFQVRPECDALYASSIEPWSYYLTGTQGVPPNPFYDPLEFAVEETHKRGMELHAWFNPYRAIRSVGTFPIAPNHVTVQHPDWILNFGSLKMLDPGLPQVREYVARIVTDIVRRYDVDGIHADDYFYPYPPSQITNQDDSTFAHYPRGFTNRGDWRRDNVHLLLTMIHDSIQVLKPFVKFGMSPFGIWKNGVPPGITGLDAYSTIYCDAITWLRRGIIDYLTPQLYWRIGGSQDYNALSQWWSDSVAFYGRHFYPGKIFGSYTTSELPNQVRIDRANPKTQGSVFFRAAYFPSNSLGFADSCRTDLYRYLALHPVMRWKDSVVPYPPRAIRYARLPGSGPAAIQWDLPIIAPDGDSASRYAVYRFDHANILPSELDSAKNIVSIEGRRYSTPGRPPAQGPWYYVTTSLDRNYNESITSSVLTVNPPVPPVLASPASGTQDIPPVVTLAWNGAATAGLYHLQMGSDSLFVSGLLVNDSTVADTFRILTGMNGQTTYYWRVRSINAGGWSTFASAFSFRTGFPALPLLASPANYATDVQPVNARLAWRPAAGAITYRVQLATDFAFTQLLVDSSGVTDTTIGLPPLTASTVYFWRVNAENAIGLSAWTDIWRFRTVTTSVEQVESAPTEFALRQNYPNPFNPSTTIAFSIPKQVQVSLRVYDVLGREVETLVDDVLAPGVYRVTFNASNRASGIYFYRLIAGSYVQTKKMQFLK